LLIDQRPSVATSPTRGSADPSLTADVGILTSVLDRLGSAQLVTCPALLTIDQLDAIGSALAVARQPALVSLTLTGATWIGLAFTPALRPLLPGPYQLGVITATNPAAAKRNWPNDLHPARRRTARRNAPGRKRATQNPSPQRSWTPQRPSSPSTTSSEWCDHRGRSHFSRPRPGPTASSVKTDPSQQPMTGSGWQPATMPPSGVT
jgi:hypothetical protein